jgi:hypothetical protein
VGVTQPARDGPFQLRLKFGKQHYCVIELRPGEEAAEVAKKLRELADQSRAKNSDVGRYGRWSRRQRIEELLGIEPSA